MKSQQEIQEDAIRHYKEDSKRLAPYIEQYRAMRKSVEGMSYKEQLDAINRFRCGNW